MTPASRHLASLGVPHREYVHPGPVASLEQAAAERGQRPDQVVRSILFRISDGEYVLAIVAGPRQVAWPALRRILGQSRLTMATPEEVLAVTGFETGAVSPFGLPAVMRMLLDRSVLEQTEVSIGSGVRGTTIFITVANLHAALPNAEIVNMLQAAG